MLGEPSRDPGRGGYILDRQRERGHQVSNVSPERGGVDPIHPQLLADCESAHPLLPGSPVNQEGPKKRADVNGLGKVAKNRPEAAEIHENLCRI